VRIKKKLSSNTVGRTCTTGKPPVQRLLGEPVQLVLRARGGFGNAHLGKRYLRHIDERLHAVTALRLDQNNRASSLTDFFRNWGGSFGIALITIVAERRQQFHQTNVGSAISATSEQFAARTQALADYLVSKGFTGPDAALAAQGGLFEQLQHQVNLLAFMDCFRIQAWVTLVTIPVLFAIRHFKPAGKPPVGH
jgi:hypothetical protein